MLDKFVGQAKRHDFRRFLEPQVARAQEWERWNARYRQWDRWNSAQRIYWTPTGIAYTRVWDSIPDRQGRRYVIPTMRMTPSGRARAHVIVGRLLSATGVERGYMAYESVGEMVPSPDGRMASIVIWNNQQGDHLDFADIEQARILPLRITVRHTYSHFDWWWQSDNEIGYLENNERRRIVRVTE